MVESAEVGTRSERTVTSQHKTYSGHPIPTTTPESRSRADHDLGHPTEEDVTRLAVVNGIPAERSDENISPGTSTEAPSRKEQRPLETEPSPRSSSHDGDPSPNAPRSRIGSGWGYPPHPDLHGRARGTSGPMSQRSSVDGRTPRIRAERSRPPPPRTSEPRTVGPSRWKRSRITGARSERAPIGSVGEPSRRRRPQKTRPPPRGEAGPRRGHRGRASGSGEGGR